MGKIMIIQNGVYQPLLAYTNLYWRMPTPIGICQLSMVVYTNVNWHIPPYFSLSDIELPLVEGGKNRKIGKNQSYIVLV